MKTYREITKGSIVINNIDKGYYRVTDIIGDKVNLGAIFGTGIFYKDVLVDSLIECEDEWNAKVSMYLQLRK